MRDSNKRYKNLYKQRYIIPKTIVSQSNYNHFKSLDISSIHCTLLLEINQQYQTVEQVIQTEVEFSTLHVSNKKAHRQEIKNW